MIGTQWGGGESDDVEVGSLAVWQFGGGKIVMGGGGTWLLPPPVMIFVPIDSSSLQKFSHPSTMVKSYL
jgi:hypothetical protein